MAAVIVMAVNIASALARIRLLKPLQITMRLEAEMLLTGLIHRFDGRQTPNALLYGLTCMIQSKRWDQAPIVACRIQKNCHSL